MGKNLSEEAGLKAFIIDFAIGIILGVGMALLVHDKEMEGYPFVLFIIFGGGTMFLSSTVSTLFLISMISTILITNGTIPIGFIIVAIFILIIINSSKKVSKT